MSYSSLLAVSLAPPASLTHLGGIPLLKCGLLVLFGSFALDISDSLVLIAEEDTLETEVVFCIWVSLGG